MRIYSVGMHFDVPKPEAGGEGVESVLAPTTWTHKPPQIFLRQLAPVALALHL